MKAGGWYLLEGGDPRRVWDSSVGRFSEDRTMHYENGFTFSSQTWAKQEAARLRTSGVKTELVSRKELFRRLGVVDIRGWRE